ncbi:hypothetical protein AWC38_SpisGene7067 [Stylophora pistillata]|uniref:Rhamnogalacturonase A/B/Epimerase-like pectate lyase domain-containing protein n=1 Tax=Stylophora pistillata TaxID=50429 RepID=A0A2B4SH23_STYPI|nr:hypothetical protein AWC38_SpisGene7067 [Stylophora pistillata]
MISILVVLLAPNNLKRSDDVPTAMTNVKQPGGSLTAVVGDGKTADDTSAIQAIVNHVAGSTNNKVFFSRGEYLVSGDITISGSVELHETHSGIVVIKASNPHAIQLYSTSPVKFVSLKYLYFNRILVEFNGGTQESSATNDITIESCVFFSSSSPSSIEEIDLQLDMQMLGNSSVYRNVFFTGFREDEDIYYSVSVFEILGTIDPTEYACVWLTNGNLSQHHVYTDNIYYGTATPVKLQANEGTLSYETGDIDQEFKDLYSYPAYKLNIPPS